MQERPLLFTRKVNVGPSASVEVEALLNDMEQARGLAADYQRALAGKSNEFAELKQVFEKTQRDLAHLQGSVTELREERHRLANEAMRAAALELRVERITNDRDQLRAELEALKKRISTPAVLGLTPVEAEQTENPIDRLANVDLIMSEEDQADRDFIHIAYKKEAIPENVATETPIEIKPQRTVRTKCPDVLELRSGRRNGAGFAPAATFPSVIPYDRARREATLRLPLER